jgi:hypothetical protein
VVRRYALNCAQLICFFFLSAAAFAQNAPPILQAGDAAVAGFSGTIVIGSAPPPEPKRIDKTYINLNGPSLRVIGLGRMGGPAQGQLVAAPKPFTFTAGQIGQVFSLALDDASPPNIYAAATSAYGLPIVVPDADGDGVPDRERRGAPDAAFMPGLFGPVMVDGGPGSIWKIDGSTGAVTLFSNVVLGGVPNSGPALGGLAFDPASRQIFVADRDTGMIHRFTLDGIDRGQFDHGMQALSVAGLPPIAFDPRKRLNIESPTFDGSNPSTWAYAPPARRVFGLAVSRGRLYYAVAAGLRIWSVSLLPDGSFGPDARFEVSVPRSASQSAEISKILFDDNGDMLVAERGAPTGAYDYSALAESPENHVLRFRPKGPDDPPSRDLWFPVPKEYAIGFPPTYRNDNGGIAIGYGYDVAGNINRAVCGGTLWSTGEQLRNARDRSIIQRLQTGGPLIVDGLQGNATSLLRPLNEPPFETYFIDYDDRFDDPQTRGYLGDVTIWRVCGQAVLPVGPVPIVCPAGLFDVDGVCQFGLACPAGTEFSNGCCVYRDCPASYVRIHGKCVPPSMHCKRDETFVDGHCEAPKCPAGLVPVKRKAGSNGLPTVSGSNAALNRLPSGNNNGGRPNMCNNYCSCPEGTQLSKDGTCKPPSSCGLHRVESGGECICEPDYRGVIGSDGKSTCIPTSQCDPSAGITAGCCPQGQHWNTIQCEPDNPSPKLKIVKQLNICCALSVGGTSKTLCEFSISVTNIGTVPFTGETAVSDADPNSSGPNGTAVGTLNGPLAPGETKFFSGSLREYLPGAKLSNCATLGTRPPINSGPPGPDIFCVFGQAPTNAPACTMQNGLPIQRSSGCPNGAQRNSDGNCPTPPTITVTCPAGAVVLNGQCYVPTCQGGNCPPPVIGGCPGGVARNSDGNCPTGSGCPGGVARNSDGNCPTTSGCTGGKVFDGRSCRCGSGMTDKNGTCVRSGSEPKKTKKIQRTRQPRSNSDNPGSSSPSPNIQIQIGPGFPSGGGHPSGGRPPGGNVPNRTKG